MNTDITRLLAGARAELDGQVREALTDLEWKLLLALRGELDAAERLLSLLDGAPPIAITVAESPIRRIAGLGVGAVPGTVELAKAYLTTLDVQAPTARARARLPPRLCKTLPTYAQVDAVLHSRQAQRQTPQPQPPLPAMDDADGTGSVREPAQPSRTRKHCAHVIPKPSPLPASN